MNSKKNQGSSYDISFKSNKYWAEFLNIVSERIKIRYKKKFTDFY